MPSVLITEAQSGIGAAIAVGLAESGAQVIAASKDGAFPNGDVGGLGIVPITLDLSDPTSIADGVAEAAEVFPGLDVVIANGTIGTFSPFELMPADELTNVLNTNLVGQLHFLRAAIPHLRRAERGRIVGISSPVGMLGLPGGVAPCAARAGLEVALSAMYHELRPFGVGVSVVQAAPEDASAYGLPWIPESDVDDEYLRLGTAVNEFGCQVEPSRMVVQTIKEVLAVEEPSFRYASDPSHVEFTEKLRKADHDETSAVLGELFQLVP